LSNFQAPKLGLLSKAFSESYHGFPDHWLGASFGSSIAFLLRCEDMKLATLIQGT